MQITAAKAAKAENYCMSRSYILRENKENSKWLIGEALKVMPRDREALTAHLRNKVKEKKISSPVLMWILLYVVVPIIVRLILEWWFKENK